MPVAIGGIVGDPNRLDCRTLRSAPIHGFDADAAGAGKGLACSVVTIIVTGTMRPRLTSAPPTPNSASFCFRRCWQMIK